jgi:hypothetical protein
MPLPFAAAMGAGPSGNPGFVERSDPKGDIVWANVHVSGLRK